MVIGDVRNGLKTNLATITGLRCYEVVPDSLAVPAAVVGIPNEIVFDSTLNRSNDMAVFPIRIFIGKASDRNAQKLLDVYLASTGASSVKYALEADSSLSGAANTIKVDRASGIGVYTVNGVDYLGAEFSVRVWG
jgi:hypothetical protein